MTSAFASFTSNFVEASGVASEAVRSSLTSAYVLSTFFDFHFCGCVVLLADRADGGEEGPDLDGLVPLRLAFFRAAPWLLEICCRDNMQRW